MSAIKDSDNHVGTKYKYKNRKKKTWPNERIMHNIVNKYSDITISVRLNYFTG